MAVASVDFLKCHNCSDGYLCRPTYRCKSNHLLCPDCSGRRRCPVCGRTFYRTTCTDLEKMADTLLKSCPYSGHGCRKMMPSEKVSVHQNHCDFREHMCRSLVGPEGCSWSGTREELTKHLLNKHSAIPSAGFMHSFVIQNYSLVESFSSTVLLQEFSHLFLAKLQYSESKKAFCGGVQFLSGDPLIASEFRYEFQIGKETKSKVAHYKFMYSRQTHRVSEYIPSDDYDQFCFDKDIGSFFTDIDDTLTVTVILKSVQSLAMQNYAAAETYGFVPSQYCQRCVSSFNPSPPF